MPMFDVTMGRGAATVETKTVRVRVTDADVLAAQERGDFWANTASEEVQVHLAVRRATVRRWGRSAQWTPEHGTHGLRGQVTRPARDGHGSDCITPTIGADVVRLHSTPTRTVTYEVILTRGSHNYGKPIPGVTGRLYRTIPSAIRAMARGAGECDTLRVVEHMPGEELGDDGHVVAELTWERLF